METELLTQATQGLWLASQLIDATHEVIDDGRAALAKQADYCAISAVFPYPERPCTKSTVARPLRKSSKALSCLRRPPNNSCAFTTSSASGRSAGRINGS